MTAAALSEDEQVLRACRQILEHNSKSFALAARLLSPAARDRAAAVYAFCRRVDDAIDEAPPFAQPEALHALQGELERLYVVGDSFQDPSLRAFQAVVKICNLPRRYPSELIAGMAMDVQETRYETLEDLLLYCHRVAGVVGLMMCHVFGLSRDDALVNAAHLGIAMQLTNICRDVQEDWSLGRLYLPRRMLEAAGAAPLPPHITGPFPQDAATITAMQSVMRSLLVEADRYYASASQGISALPFRAGLAVRAAGTLYRAIGIMVAERSYDPRRGRAVVPLPKKLALVAESSRQHLASLPSWLGERVAHAPRPPQRELLFPDVLGSLAHL